MEELIAGFSYHDYKEEKKASDILDND